MKLIFRLQMKRNWHDFDNFEACESDFTYLEGKKAS